MTLAIFDLDNTLLDGDSDHAWGQFLIHRGIVNATEYQRRNDQFYQDYVAGRLNVFDYLAFALEPLTRFSAQELEALHNTFMQDVISRMHLPKAKALLDQHREQGDHLLIITATNRFITAPIAAQLGVDALLATDPECVDGRYTGRVRGTPCFREGKVTRLSEWLQRHPFDLTDSYFYSDSHNDLPLLEQVGKPVAVDPDDTLRATAEARHWPIISLRE